MCMKDGIIADPSKSLILLKKDLGRTYDRLMRNLNSI